MKKKHIFKKIIIVFIILFVGSKLLNGCEKKKPYVWPNSEIADLIPQPKSNLGEVNWDNEDSFDIDVYKTSREDYETYVESCKEAGFTVDYSRHDDSYYADDDNGNSLSLRYDANEKKMNISLHEPYDLEEDETNKEDSGETDQKTEEAHTGIRDEFKEMMDSYEAFFDEYIEFMEKYEKSNNSVSLMSDYLDYMNKYTEYMTKMEEIDEDELSNEEMIYFIEVQSRISSKLLEVSE